MIGVVVPAHNEQDVIVQCIRCISRAAGHNLLDAEPVELVVVTDSCTDGTAVLAAQAGATVLTLHARNVGAARAAGAEHLLARGARWLAFTDADTLVSPGWLAEQLALEADAVCGTVDVQDWSPHGVHADLLRSHFAQTYFDCDAHRHVHGANLGVSAAAYRRAGGFRHLSCSEDVELVSALEACGARIAWSCRPRVITSARRVARAPGGFADALLTAVAQRLAAGTPHLPSLGTAS
ncbi:glycosyltransferase family 2 protein [Variovorax sp. J22R115]|uniref:glycosyltransferase n=1 Tax=Variovorax sp. J22R115 TaxID=3053509 RepID=UPI0025786EB0|nr:glycosyltransferase [Variovorax sp. J22R115]MDM0052934.1 glycosyltransferase [Variovorax sp. J22R115]